MLRHVVTSKNVGYCSIHAGTIVTTDVHLWDCYHLEVATPTLRPLSGRGCHALTWLSHDHSLAAYL